MTVQLAELKTSGRFSGIQELLGLREQSSLEGLGHEAN